MKTRSRMPVCSPRRTIELILTTAPQKRPRTHHPQASDSPTACPDIQLSQPSPSTPCLQQIDHNQRNHQKPRLEARIFNLGNDARASAWRKKRRELLLHVGWRIQECNSQRRTNRIRRSISGTLLRNPTQWNRPHPNALWRRWYFFRNRSYLLWLLREDLGNCR